MTEKTCADFTPLVNQKFTVTLAAADPEDGIAAVETELELTRVIETGDDLCEGFSLLFKGGGDRSLAQRTYKMRNDTAGEMEIFITPIATGKEGEPLEGNVYQAVFNRLKPAAAAANPLPKPGS